MFCQKKSNFSRFGKSYCFRCFLLQMCNNMVQKVNTHEWSRQNWVRIYFPMSWKFSSLILVIAEKTSENVRYDLWMRLIDLFQHRVFIDFWLPSEDFSFPLFLSSILLIGNFLRLSEGFYQCGVSHKLHPPLFVSLGKHMKVHFIIDNLTRKRQYLLGTKNLKFCNYQFHLVQ